MPQGSSAVRPTNGLYLLTFTEVLKQPISPIFKGQAIEAFFDCLTLEDGTDRLYRKVRN